MCTGELDQLSTWTPAITDVTTASVLMGGARFFLSQVGSYCVGVPVRLGILAGVSPIENDRGGANGYVTIDVSRVSELATAMSRQLG